MTDEIVTEAEAILAIIDDMDDATLAEFEAWLMEDE